MDASGGAFDSPIYQGDLSGNDGGVVPVTEVLTEYPPDASGGNGSFPPALQQVLTAGLTVGLNKALSPGAFSSGLYTVDAYGNVKTVASPGQNLSFAQQANRTLSSPLVLIGVIALIAVAIVASK